jgi:hypothetical protein
MLTSNEIIFIIDFLIDICKYYQVLDKHALTLGINLLPDFYQKACNLHQDVLENAKKQN